MSEIDVGDRVRILTGEHVERVGIVYAVTIGAYPVYVGFRCGNTNAYYPEQVELITEV